MGTDNLFHKRKAKGNRELERKRARREPYDKVLIVTEGKKTEPEYFEDLKKYYRIHSANIKIDGSGDSSPESVVKYGKKLYEDERSRGDAFDRVYFVFDKDTHLTYSQALDEIKRYGRKNTFFAINSVPCFEYWLLLHFTYTTEPFKAAGKLSVADAVIKKVRKHIPDYEKSTSGLFVQLYDQLEQAKKHAVLSMEEASKTGTDNPSTRVHELVDYLQNIKTS